MRTSRYYLGAAVALLLGGAGAIRVFTRSTAPEAARADLAPAHHGSALPAKAKVQRGAASDLVTRLRERERMPAVERSSTPIPTGEDYAKRRCVQLLMALGSTYVFSGAETEALSDRYAFYQSVRGAFELSIAQVAVRGGALEVAIPAYPTAGAELQEMMRRDFDQVLGPERGQGVWQMLQDPLREDFAQFGAAKQTVSAVAHRADAGETEFNIRRAVEWTGGDGNKRTSGSAANLAASQIEDTDYVFLSPLLRQISPEVDHGLH